MRRTLPVVLALIVVPVPASALDYILRADSSAVAASLMCQYGLLPTVPDANGKPVCPTQVDMAHPYIQGSSAYVDYFGVFIGTVNVPTGKTAIDPFGNPQPVLAPYDTGFWGRLRWNASFAPQFPKGLTVYTPATDPKSGVTTWSPTIPDAVVSAIPTIN